MSSFEGKVALLTGASTGIGRATAIEFAKRGATVVFGDVNDVGAHETIETIEAMNGTAKYLKTDVTKMDDCQDLVQFTQDEFGQVDVACNSAGIGDILTPILGMTEQQWQRVIDVNLSGTFYMTQAEMAVMSEQGHGAIVNIASVLGQVGTPFASAYVASKHGVVGLTKVAAQEMARAGVRVNAVGPGFVDTPMIEQLTGSEEQTRKLLKMYPMRRLGQPEEIAHLILWLCSDEASFVTGSYYPIDGGFLSQ